jgi:Family of unknown function (DUF6069)
MSAPWCGSASNATLIELISAFPSMVRSGESRAQRHYRPVQGQDNPEAPMTAGPRQSPHGSHRPASGRRWSYTQRATDHNPRSATRPTVAAGTLWAGGFATAVVAALAYGVGIVIARVVFDIPVLAPERDGALGDSATWQLALTAFGVALLATALMHLLLVVTPRPYSFFGWIMGLATVLVTVLPFAQDARNPARSRRQSSTSSWEPRSPVWCAA